MYDMYEPLPPTSKTAPQEMDIFGYNEQRVDAPWMYNTAPHTSPVNDYLHEPTPPAFTSPASGNGLRFGQPAASYGPSTGQPDIFGNYSLPPHNPPFYPQQEFYNTVPVSGPTPVPGDKFPMSVSFNNVGFKAKDRVILEGVSGVARPGRILAVMGPSGAGKTTALTIIGDRMLRTKGNELTGEVYINEIQYTPHWRKAFGFVTQEDIVFDTAKVKEAIRFAGTVKTRDATKAEISQRTTEVINDLHISRCADTIIGTPGYERGVSGGERKRVNIGVEWITRPRILILDEPTSGLDSHSALIVVQLMKDLANAGDTVICTLHQPSSQIVDLLDDLLLLVNGRMAYMGSKEDLPNYFASFGHHIPRHYNLMDFSLRVLSNNGEQCIEQWKAAYPQRLAVPSQAPLLVTPPMARAGYQNGFAFPDAGTTRHELDTFSRSTTSTFRQQTSALLARSWKNYMRSKGLLTLRLVQTLVFSLIIGFLYYNMKRDQVGITDRLGFVFIVVINSGFSAMFSGLSSFPPERAVFLKEQAGKFYSPYAAVVAKFFAELPFQITLPWLYATIVYWLSGLTRKFPEYLLFTLMIILVCNAMAGLGLIIAAFFSNVEAAMAVAPAVSMPLMLVAGLMASTERLDKTLIWLRYISPLRYGVVAIIRNEMNDIQSVSCNSSACPWKNGQQIIDFFGFKEPIWLCFVLAGVICFVLRVGAACVLAWVGRRRSG